MQLEQTHAQKQTLIHTHTLGSKKILTLVITVLIVNVAGIVVGVLASLIVVTVVIVICRFR